MILENDPMITNDDSTITDPAEKIKQLLKQMPVPKLELHLQDKRQMSIILDAPGANKKTLKYMRFLKSFAGTAKNALHLYNNHDLARVTLDESTQLLLDFPLSLLSEYLLKLIESFNELSTQKIKAPQEIITVSQFIKLIDQLGNSLEIRSIAPQPTPDEGCVFFQISPSKTQPLKEDYERINALKQLSKLIIPTNAAYVMWGNNFFYINKKANICQSADAYFGSMTTQDGYTISGKERRKQVIEDSLANMKKMGITIPNLPEDKLTQILTNNAQQALEDIQQALEIKSLSQDALTLLYIMTGQHHIDRIDRISECFSEFKEIVLPYLKARKVLAYAKGVSDEEFLPSDYKITEEHKNTEHYKITTNVTIKNSFDTVSSNLEKLATATNPGISEKIKAGLEKDRAEAEKQQTSQKNEKEQEEKRQRDLEEQKKKLAQEQKEKKRLELEAAKKEEEDKKRKQEEEKKAEEDRKRIQEEQKKIEQEKKLKQEQKKPDGVFQKEGMEPSESGGPKITGNIKGLGAETKKEKPKEEAKKIIGDVNDFADVVTAIERSFGPFDAQLKEDKKPSGIELDSLLSALGTIEKQYQIIAKTIVQASGLTDAVVNSLPNKFEQLKKLLEQEKNKFSSGTFSLANFKRVAVDANPKKEIAAQIASIAKDLWTILVYKQDRYFPQFKEVTDYPNGKASPSLLSYTVENLIKTASKRPWQAVITIDGAENQCFGMHNMRYKQESAQQETSHLLGSTAQIDNSKNTSSPKTTNGNSVSPKPSSNSNGNATSPKPSGNSNGSAKPSDTKKFGTTKKSSSPKKQLSLAERIIKLNETLVSIYHYVNGKTDPNQSLQNLLASLSKQLKELKEKLPTPFNANLNSRFKALENKLKGIIKDSGKQDESNLGKEFSIALCAMEKDIEDLISSDVKKFNFSEQEKKNNLYRAGIVLPRFGLPLPENAKSNAENNNAGLLFQLFKNSVTTKFHNATEKDIEGKTFSKILADAKAKSSKKKIKNKKDDAPLDIKRTDNGPQNGQQPPAPPTPPVATVESKTEKLEQPLVVENEAKSLAEFSDDFIDTLELVIENENFLSGKNIENNGDITLLNCINNATSFIEAAKHIITTKIKTEEKNDCINYLNNLDLLIHDYFDQDEESELTQIQEAEITAGMYKALSEVYVLLSDTDYPNDYGNTIDGLYKKINDAFKVKGLDLATYIQKFMDMKLTRPKRTVPPIPPAPNGKSTKDEALSDEEAENEQNEEDGSAENQAKDFNEVKEKLAQKLTSIKTNNPTSRIIQGWGDSFGLMHVLQKELGPNGKYVHFIHADLGSVEGVFSSDSNVRTQAALNYCKNLVGFYDSTGIRTPNVPITNPGAIDKPIVLLLNTSSAKALSNTDAKASGGSHWVVSVILPANYLNNGKLAQVITIDPLGYYKLPATFKNFMQGGITVELEQTNPDGQPIIHRIPPALPQVKDEDFIDLDVKQQIGNDEDCAWWLAYNVFELITTGKTDFCKAQKDRRLAMMCRQEWPQIEEHSLGVDRPREATQKVLPKNGFAAFLEFAPAAQYIAQIKQLLNEIENFNNPNVFKLTGETLEEKFNQLPRLFDALNPYRNNPYYPGKAVGALNDKYKQLALGNQQPQQPQGSKNPASNYQAIPQLPTREQQINQRKQPLATPASRSISRNAQGSLRNRHNNIEQIKFEIQHHLDKINEIQAEINLGNINFDDIKYLKTAKKYLEKINDLTKNDFSNLGDIGEKYLLASNFVKEFEKRFNNKFPENSQLPQRATRIVNPTKIGLTEASVQLASHYMEIPSGNYKAIPNAIDTNTPQPPASQPLSSDDISKLNNYKPLPQTTQPQSMESLPEHIALTDNEANISWIFTNVFNSKDLKKKLKKLQNNLDKLHNNIQQAEGVKNFPESRKNELSTAYNQYDQLFIGIAILNQAIQFNKKWNAFFTEHAGLIVIGKLLREISLANNRMQDPATKIRTINPLLQLINQYIPIMMMLSESTNEDQFRKDIINILLNVTENKLDHETAIKEIDSKLATNNKYQEFKKRISNRPFIEMIEPSSKSGMRGQKENTLNIKKRLDKLNDQLKEIGRDDFVTACNEHLKNINSAMLSMEYIARSNHEASHPLQLPPAIFLTPINQWVSYADNLADGVTAYTEFSENGDWVDKARKQKDFSIEHTVKIQHSIFELNETAVQKDAENVERYLQNIKQSDENILNSLKNSKDDNFETLKLKLYNIEQLIALCNSWMDRIENHEEYLKYYKLQKNLQPMATLSQKVGALLQQIIQSNNFSILQSEKDPLVKWLALYKYAEHIKNLNKDRRKQFADFIQKRALYIINQAFNQGYQLEPNGPTLLPNDLLNAIAEQIQNHTPADLNHFMAFAYKIMAAFNYLDLLHDACVNGDYGNLKDKYPIREFIKAIDAIQNPNLKGYIAQWQQAKEIVEWKLRLANFKRLDVNENASRDAISANIVQLYQQRPYAGMNSDDQPEYLYQLFESRFNIYKLLELYIPKYVQEHNTNPQLAIDPALLANLPDDDVLYNILGNLSEYDQGDQEATIAAIKQGAFDRLAAHGVSAATINDVPEALIKLQLAKMIASYICDESRERLETMPHVPAAHIAVAEEIDSLSEPNTDNTTQQSQPIGDQSQPTVPSSTPSIPLSPLNGTATVSNDPGIISPTVPSQPTLGNNTQSNIPPVSSIPRDGSKSEPASPTNQNSGTNTGTQQPISFFTAPSPSSSASHGVLSSGGSGGDERRPIISNGPFVTTNEQTRKVEAYQIAIEELARKELDASQQQATLFELFKKRTVREDRSTTIIVIAGLIFAGLSAAAAVGTVMSTGSAAGGPANPTVIWSAVFAGLGAGVGGFFLVAGIGFGIRALIRKLQGKTSGLSEGKQVLGEFKDLTAETIKRAKDKVTGTDNVITIDPETLANKILYKLHLPLINGMNQKENDVGNTMLKVVLQEYPEPFAAKVAEHCIFKILRGTQVNREGQTVDSSGFPIDSNGRSIANSNNSIPHTPVPADSNNAKWISQKIIFDALSSPGQPRTPVLTALLNNIASSPSFQFTDQDGTQINNGVNYIIRFFWQQLVNVGNQFPIPVNTGTAIVPTHPIVSVFANALPKTQRTILNTFAPLASAMVSDEVKNQNDAARPIAYEILQSGTVDNRQTVIQHLMTQLYLNRANLITIDKQTGQVTSGPFFAGIHEDPVIATYIPEVVKVTRNLTDIADQLNRHIPLLKKDTKTFDEFVAEAQPGYSGVHKPIDTKINIIYPVLHFSFMLEVFRQYMPFNEATGELEVTAENEEKLVAFLQALDPVNRNLVLKRKQEFKNTLTRAIEDPNRNAVSQQRIETIFRKAFGHLKEYQNTIFIDLVLPYLEAEAAATREKRPANFTAANNNLHKFIQEQKNQDKLPVVANFLAALLSNQINVGSQISLSIKKQICYYALDTAYAYDQLDITSQRIKNPVVERISADPNILAGLLAVLATTEERSCKELLERVNPTHLLKALEQYPIEKQEINLAALQNQTDQNNGYKTLLYLILQQEKNNETPEEDKRDSFLISFEEEPEENTQNGNPQRAALDITLKLVQSIINAPDKKLSEKQQQLLDATLSTFNTFCKDNDWYETNCSSVAIYREINSSYSIEDELAKLENIKKQIANEVKTPQQRAKKRRSIGQIIAPLEKREKENKLTKQESKQLQELRDQVKVINLLQEKDETKEKINSIESKENLTEQDVKELQQLQKQLTSQKLAKKHFNDLYKKTAPGIFTVFDEDFKPSEKEIRNAFIQIKDQYPDTIPEQNSGKERRLHKYLVNLFATQNSRMDQGAEQGIILAQKTLTRATNCLIKLENHPDAETFIAAYLDFLNDGTFNLANSMTDPNYQEGTTAIINWLIALSKSKLYDTSIAEYASTIFQKISQIDAKSEHLVGNNEGVIALLCKMEEKEQGSAGRLLNIFQNADNKLRDSQQVKPGEEYFNRGDFIYRQTLLSQILLQNSKVTEVRQLQTSMLFDIAKNSKDSELENNINGFLNNIMAMLNFITSTGSLNDLYCDSSNAPLFSIPETITTDQQFENVVGQLGDDLYIKAHNNENRTLCIKILNALLNAYGNSHQPSERISKIKILVDQLKVTADSEADVFSQADTKPIIKALNKLDFITLTEFENPDLDGMGALLKDQYKELDEEDFGLWIKDLLTVIFTKNNNKQSLTEKKKQQANEFVVQCYLQGLLLQSGPDAENAIHKVIDIYQGYLAEKCLANKKPTTSFMSSNYWDDDITIEQSSLPTLTEQDIENINTATQSLFNAVKTASPKKKADFNRIICQHPTYINLLSKDEVVAMLTQTVTKVTPPKNAGVRFFSQKVLGSTGRATESEKAIIRNCLTFLYDQEVEHSTLEEVLKKLFAALPDAYREVSGAMYGTDEENKDASWGAVNAIIRKVHSSVSGERTRLTFSHGTTPRPRSYGATATGNSDQHDLVLDPIDDEEGMEDESAQLLNKVKDKKSVAQRINVTSFDLDGCIFYENFIDAFRKLLQDLEKSVMPNYFKKKAVKKFIIEQNAHLINFILTNRGSFDEYKYIIGSNRHSPVIDFTNSNKSGNDKERNRVEFLSPSCTFALNTLCEAFQEKIKDGKKKCSVIKTLLSDIYGDQPEGSNFDFIFNNLIDHNNGLYLDRKKRPNADNYLNDESKVTILYEQMHEIASKNPKAEIVFDFYDDRYNPGNKNESIPPDILEGLANFFKENKNLIPHNLKLNLHHYNGQPQSDGEYVKTIASIQGTGVIDQNYANNVKLMVAAIGIDPADIKDNVSNMHPTIDQLSTYQFIAANQSKLLDRGNPVITELLRVNNNLKTFMDNRVCDRKFDTYDYANIAEQTINFYKNPNAMQLEPPVETINMALQ